MYFPPPKCLILKGFTLSYSYSGHFPRVFIRILGESGHLKLLKVSNFKGNAGLEGISQRFPKVFGLCESGHFLGDCVSMGVYGTFGFY